MVSLKITQYTILPHLSWWILILASKSCVSRKKSSRARYICRTWNNARHIPTARAATEKSTLLFCLPRPNVPPRILAVVDLPVAHPRGSAPQPPSSIWATKESRLFQRHRWTLAAAMPPHHRGPLLGSIGFRGIRVHPYGTFTMEITSGGMCVWLGTTWWGFNPGNAHD
jgi:hypothetical protein